MAFQDVDESGQIEESKGVPAYQRHDNMDDSFEELSHSLPLDIVDVMGEGDGKSDTLDQLLEACVETDRSTLVHNNSSGENSLADWISIPHYLNRINHSFQSI